MCTYTHRRHLISQGRSERNFFKVRSVAFEKFICALKFINQHGNINRCGGFFGFFLLNCEELGWYLVFSAAVTWRIKRKELSWKNWWCRNSFFSKTVIFTAVQREVSQSLVRRECKFLQGVRSCDSSLARQCRCSCVTCVLPCPVFWSERQVCSAGLKR